MIRFSRVVRLALAVCLLGLLPISAGVFAASSGGADGDIVFVAGGDLAVRSSSSGSATLLGLSGSPVDPSWSPDGTTLAFSSAGSIRTCGASSCSGSVGGALAAGTEPVWSPDGGSIAYASGGDVWTMTSSGGNQTRLTTSGGADPSWSPSSTGKIVFALGGSIYTIAASTPGSGTPLSISGPSGPLSQPAWSPDGSQIAFQASDGSKVQIWVVASSGGTATRVTTAADVDKTAPSWAPNGDGLVFAESGQGIYSATQSGSSWSAPTQLHSGASDATPDWQTVPPIDISAPTITGSGSPQTGDLLTATNGTWQGASATGYSYQWQRCDAGGGSCSDISGQTAQTYAVLAGDIGATLRVAVRASNAAGTASAVASAATGVVVAAGTVTAPSLSAYPTVTLFGTSSQLVVGSSLSASRGSWSGSFPIQYAYQWTWCEPSDPLNGSCFPIPNATSSFLLVPASVYGKRLRIRITATNGGGTAHASSAATDVVGAIAPRLRRTPPIEGANVVGQLLRVGTGTWDGAPVPAIAYEWRRCDPYGTPETCVPIPGATTSTYIPVPDDIGAALRVYLTGSNLAGSDTEYTNHTYPIVDRQHFAPSELAPPEISGSTGVGVLLTATDASFQGDEPMTSAVQWQRCDATGSSCRAIQGATTLKYTPTAADVGSTLRVVVTASNAYGKGESTSPVTEAVSGAYPHRPGSRITGTAAADYLIGTPYDDVILGGGGNDTLVGNGGYDRIEGGAGNDVITVAGPGGSRVDAGPGSDTVYAANGVEDTVDCGSGRDRAVVDPADVVHGCEVVDTGGGAGSGGSIGGGGTAGPGSTGVSGPGG